MISMHHVMSARSCRVRTVAEIGRVLRLGAGIRYERVGQDIGDMTRSDGDRAFLGASLV